MKMQFELDFGDDFELESKRKSRKEREAEDLIEIGFDLSGFDEVFGSEFDETRYVKPKIYRMDSQCVMYSKAEELARDIVYSPNFRYDVLMAGNFVFGDFVEAFITKFNIKCKRLIISTLSLNQENVESLHDLITHEYVDQLDLIISDYFYSTERRGLIPFIYQQLDIDDKFQLAVASTHTKTVQIETLGGKKIIMHGSANYRSSASVEQMVIEENKDVYDFYEEAFDKIIDRYKTINKAVRNKPLWDTITKVKFND